MTDFAIFVIIILYKDLKRTRLKILCRPLIRE